MFSAASTIFFGCIFYVGDCINFVSIVRFDGRSFKVDDDADVIFVRQFDHIAEDKPDPVIGRNDDVFRNHMTITIHQGDRHVAIIELLGEYRDLVGVVD